MCLVPNPVILEQPQLLPVAKWIFLKHIFYLGDSSVLSFNLI